MTSIAFDISKSKRGRRSVGMAATNVGTIGHVYQYLGWQANKVLKRDDVSKAKVILRDITKGEVITRNGKVYMLGDPVVFIDSLEGCKEVQVCLNVNGEYGKVGKLTPSSGYRLQPV